MTTEEVGAYILLLCKAWREVPPGSLPSDDRTLGRWARLSDEAWSAAKARVMAAFTLGTDLRWHQKRLRAEFDKLARLARQKSEAAKSRWRKEFRARALQMQCDPIVDVDEAIPSQIGKEKTTEIGPGLPISEAQAVEWASLQMVPKEFAIKVYNQLAGRGWVDGAGRDITSWRNHIHYRWQVEKKEWEDGPPKRQLSPMDIRTIIAAKDKKRADLRAKYCSEGPLSNDWRDPNARADYITLSKEIKTLNNQLSNMA